MEREIRNKNKIDIMEALRIYYQYIEIGNAEIRTLFRCTANDTIAKKKQPVLAKMARDSIRVHTHGHVNTRVAFEVWGIDVKELEMRRKNLIRLGFIKEEELLSCRG